ncbi:MAG TPA: HAD-IA family hydrolase [Acidobacteriaceae bacterium]|nr:HAD-IA family hydrolase [Acidobacteriaceae bacterium]
MESIKIQARGLLFDMDGVLISSLGSVERSWETWARQRGLDATATVKAAHGMRAIDTVRKLWPHGDHAAELKVIEDLEVADTADLQILEGVKPILQSIPQRYWTIVTSATERLARARLSYAGIPVPERIITGDMVLRGKPDPEPYIRGAQLLGVAPSECVVIEDSRSGAEAGRAAGCRVLATIFSHSIEALSAADWIVESLSKVKVSVTVPPENSGLELEIAPVAVHSNESSLRRA